MSHTINVIGLKSNNGIIYQKHAKVLQACADAGLKTLPKETEEFFGITTPNLYALEEILEVSLKSTDWHDGDMCEGIEINIKDIPQEIDKLRFYISW